MSKIILVLLHMKRKVLNIDANVLMTRKLVQIYDFVFLKCDPQQIIYQGCARCISDLVFIKFAKYSLGTSLCSSNPVVRMTPLTENAKY